MWFVFVHTVRCQGCLASILGGVSSHAAPGASLRRTRLHCAARGDVVSSPLRSRFSELDFQGQILAWLHYGAGGRIPEGGVPRYMELSPAPSSNSVIVLYGAPMKVKGGAREFLCL